jgi:DNA-binding NarL/FixJ family response regulator
MPQIDGFDLCRLLHAEHPGAPVLLFSARDDDAVRRDAAAAGAAGLISKTASPAALAEALLATQPLP